MHKVTNILISWFVITLLLAACGGEPDEPTAEPEAATPTAVPTVASPATPTAESAGSTVTETEEITGTEEVTSAEEITSAEESTSSEEITSTEEMTDAEESASSEEITGTTEVAPSAEVTSTDEVTDSSEAGESAPITDSAEITSSAEVTETGSADSSAAAEAEPESTTVTVQSEREVTEIVGDKYAYFATVSPDGSAIVYAVSERRDRNLCVFTFANAGKVCYPVPEEFFNYPYALEWSPDSTLVAFTENPIQLGNESDIWIFDATTGEVTNRTDDGVDGNFMAADPGTYTLDYLPMWNQVDGNLYFWRSVPSGELSATRQLMRLAPDGGEAELVRDLSTATGEEVLYFDSEDYYLDGVSTLSPDGSKVAMLVTLPFGPYDASTQGLWMVDLSSEESAPQQLMTLDEFQSALAPFQTLPATPVGLAWTNDSNGLIAAAFSNDTHSPMLVFYYVDTSDGSVTPIVDFSEVPDLETHYSVIDEAGLPMRYYAPWTASLSPEGDKLLMYNDLGGVPGMLLTQLPPDGSKPTVIYQGQYSSTGVPTRSSTASDGKLLMYGSMFTIEE